MAEPVGVHRSRPFSERRRTGRPNSRRWTVPRTKWVRPRNSRWRSGDPKSDVRCSSQCSRSAGVPRSVRASTSTVSPTKTDARCGLRTRMLRASSRASRVRSQSPAIKGTRGRIEDVSGAGRGLPLDTGETERDRRAPPLAVREVGESLERVEDTVAEIDDPFVQSGDDDVQVVDRHSREAHQRRRRPSPRQSRESCGRRGQVRSLGRHHVVERDRLQCRGRGLCVGLSVRDGEVALERLVDRRRSLCFLQVVEGLLGRATCRDQRPAAQHPCPVGGGVAERSQVVVGEGFEQFRGATYRRSATRRAPSVKRVRGSVSSMPSSVVPSARSSARIRFEVGVALAAESRLGRRAQERRLPAGLAAPRNCRRSCRSSAKASRSAARPSSTVRAAATRWSRRSRGEVSRAAARPWRR